MKLLAVVLGVASVVAVPLSKASSQAKCCLVDPNNPDLDTDGCRCFGAFKPSGEHQQCMTAAPQFKSDRIKRAWQAGCWCISETETCQNWCSTSVEAIRVLKVDKDSGENSWMMTTVADAVKQPVDVIDTDARTQCFSGCESRGFCGAKITQAWAPLPAPPKCPPISTLALTMSAVSGDVKCTATGELEFGQSCSINALPGYWCKTNTLSCVAADEEANTLVYNIVEAEQCFLVTQDPTHAPSPLPTMQPTDQPTSEPTPSPTQQPIENPTVMGCNKFNSLPQSCDADAADECSYDSVLGTCETCSYWDGTSASDKCTKSSACGFNTATGQCLYCSTMDTDQTSCEGSPGCYWSGSACKGDQGN